MESTTAFVMPTIPHTGLPSMPFASVDQVCLAPNPFVDHTALSTAPHALACMGQEWVALPTNAALACSTHHDVDFP